MKVTTLYEKLNRLIIIFIFKFLACYKGYLNAVNKILDYSKSTGKNLIEMRTNDDFKTTPLLIAALGKTFNL